MQKVVLSLLACVGALLISACVTPGLQPQASWPAGLKAAANGVDVLLLGELHDEPDHQRWHRDAIERLADRRRLAAIALEMSERGATTTGLPPESSQAAVREALRWDERAWPWAAYGPAVMAAVRAGVPVLGANLPRVEVHQAMADASLDGRLPPPELERQRQAVRDGHCGLLPASQVAPMTRA